MVWHSEPINRNNNPDDKLGNRMEMSDLCVKYNISSAQQYLPKNGEYVIDGTTGSCNACLNCEPLNMDSGSGCEVGFWGNCVSGGGGHPNYKRAAYKAPQNDCCLSGKTTIGDYTCDPKYRDGAASNACSTIFNTKCNGSALSGADCKTWCTKNNNLCKPRIQQFCNIDNNMSSQFCKDNAKTLGGMDVGVNNWCKGNPDDNFCACYKAAYGGSNELVDPAVKALLARPECYVTTCASGSGYKYDNMRTSGPCPPVNYCKNSIVLANNTSLAVSGVTQNCDQSISTAGETYANDETSKSDITLLDKFKTFFDTNKIFIIFVSILLVILGLGTVLLMDDEVPDSDHIIKEDDSFF